LHNGNCQVLSNKCKKNYVVKMIAFKNCPVYREGKDKGKKSKSKPKAKKHKAKKSKAKKSRKKR